MKFMCLPLTNLQQLITETILSLGVLYELIKFKSIRINKIR